MYEITKTKIIKNILQCILASIIVVALKGLFVQAKDIIKFWKLSKLDALVWLVTFAGVVLLDIDIGLLAGIITSLLVICIQNFKPNTCLLGVVPNTEIYLDVGRYKGVSFKLVIHYFVAKTINSCI